MIKRKSPQYDNATRATATTSAQTMSVSGWANNPTLILTNIGTAWIFVHIGGTATTTLGYPIAPNSQEVITKGNGVTSLSYIASAAGSDLHVMAGNGV